jgi:hypothetical protein
MELRLVVAVQFVPESFHFFVDLVLVVLDWVDVDQLVVLDACLVDLENLGLEDLDLEPVEPAPPRSPS